MSKTILWTDDSRFIRAAGKLMLDKLGLNIREADNGLSALSALELYDDIDAIVLDLNMPSMGGCEFLRALAKRADLPKVQVVLCTTEADMPLIAEAMRAGASAYINKPCNFDDLREKFVAIGVLDQAGSAAAQPAIAGAAS